MDEFPNFAIRAKAMRKALCIELVIVWTYDYTLYEEPRVGYSRG